jgi:hypothetical protein
MSIAENIEELIESGYGDQAYQMANKVHYPADKGMSGCLVV